MNAAKLLLGIQIVYLAAAVCVAKADPQRWDSPSGEFSVLFSGKPEISQIPGKPADRLAQLDFASHKSPNGIEHVEASSIQRTKPISEGEARHDGETWAQIGGLSNVKLSFDQFHPDDSRLTVSGTKIAEGASVTVKAVLHWGKRTFLVVSVTESSKLFPTPEGSRFLESLRQHLR